MKFKYCVILSIIFHLFLGCENKKSIINKIIIKAAEFETLVPVVLDCNHFIDYLGCKTIVIKEEDKLIEFEKILKKIKYDPNDIRGDMRAKIYIYYNNKKDIDSICMSLIVQKFNGKNIYLSGEIYNFVNDCYTKTMNSPNQKIDGVEYPSP